MYPKLKNCALKLTDKRVLYNFVEDELYELDDESFEFLSYCTGKNSFEDILLKTGCNKNESLELINYLKKERCLVFQKDQTANEKFTVKQNSRPPLKYLLLHITEKCNLKCRHCYLGEKSNRDLELGLIKKILNEFGEYGFKLLITGGEPLLHENFWDILKYARKFPIRIELLTNGTLIEEEIAERLFKYVNGVQISLDGMEEGHETLRGRGTFLKTINGIKNAKKYLNVTVATMIHSANMLEFDEMNKLMRELMVDEWILDIPAECGNLIKNKELTIDFLHAARIFKEYGYSVGIHAGEEDYSCGANLCSIDVSGNVTKCGFFDEGVGNIREGKLEDFWKIITREYLPKLSELDCEDCKVLKNCKGGCRYRALKEGGFYGKDPFMCCLYLDECKIN
ncbi:MAG: radical SAM protein [Candidatus Hydrothermarchaeota archaeon]